MTQSTAEQCAELLRLLDAYGHAEYEWGMVPAMDREASIRTQGAVAVARTALLAYITATYVRRDDPRYRIWPSAHAALRRRGQRRERRAGLRGRAMTQTTPEQHAELARLVDAWQHAIYLEALQLVPPDWQPPVLTEAMVRQALRDAGHPGDDAQADSH
jgi:hypothetical protein